MVLLESQTAKEERYFLTVVGQECTPRVELLEEKQAKTQAPKRCTLIGLKESRILKLDTQIAINKTVCV